jgi:hypothetical protein
MDGQPPLSIADVQWVLHRVPARGGTVEARVSRGGETVAVSLTLEDGWRRADDIGWRVSTWELRRIALGGMVLEAVPADDPVRAGLPEARREAPLLRVGHVGQWAPHDRAKRAGFAKGDVILAFDGRADFARETDLIRRGIDPANRGRPVPVEVRRGAETRTLTIPAE